MIVLPSGARPFTLVSENRSARLCPRTAAGARAQHLQGAEPALVRRDLLLYVASAASLVLQRPATATEILPDTAGPSSADPLVAEEAVVVSDAGTEVAEVAHSLSSAATGSKQVFLDVRVEGNSLGRVVIELLDDAKTGAARFADLAEGKEGVGYRLSKFDGIFNNFIRNEGVKSLSYNASGSSRIAGGDSVQALEDEMAASSRSHDQAGLVSIVVKEATERPVKERLVAMGGKLVTLKEQAGEAPNGTSFMITTGPAPELDATNLIVGKVVGGLDVVQAVAGLPFAKPRDSYYDKPFFEAGKMLGDKRATMAEKRFNRPLVRVMVAQSGLL